MSVTSSAPVAADPSPAPAAAAVRGARSALLPAAAWQVWGALLIVYIVWGSTYLGIRIVVETMPAMLALGIRFGLAAVIMGVILVIRKGPRVLRVTRQQLLGALLIGTLLLGIGNGGVMLGERDVPSALTALIIGVIPLVVLIIRRLMGEAIARNQIIGVTAGLLGLVILVAPLGLSVNALSVALGVPATRIHEIVKERRSVTADTAARLAKHFGGDATSWLVMQANYDLKTLPTLQDIERVVQVREQIAA